VLDNLGAIELDVIRSKRRKKSISLNVVDGKVRVLIPYHLPKCDLDKLLHEKQEWISQSVQKQQANQAATAKLFIHGEVFTYLGKPYSLQLLPALREQLTLIDNNIILHLPPSVDVRNAVIRWYWQQARQLLTVKTYEYAKIIGVLPTSITIKEYKARWGSCSIDAEINYNWKLIMAPQEVIDYVVIHELCHILQHNHSAAFWQHVEIFAPQFKQQRKWLKVNGSSLDI
jgi:predicted metal-dependent hydrolase